MDAGPGISTAIYSKSTFLKAGRIKSVSLHQSGVIFKGGPYLQFISILSIKLDHLFAGSMVY
jgi:hypothetical protein